MWKYLIPKIALGDLRVMIRYTFLGALISGSYGVLHDQVTYTIGPEYFHNFKFEQFAYADLGFGDRFFVAIIGFLATWWVGVIVGWILARRMIPACSLDVAQRKILLGFLTVFVTAFLFGVGGYLYGLFRGPDADYSYWQATLQRYQVDDHFRFMCVGYIHNAGYLGGISGIILTYVIIKPKRSMAQVQ